MFLLKVSLEKNLWQNKQHNDQGPNDNVESMVVPKSYESYSSNHRIYIFISSQRNVKISDEPLIEASMPHSPKPFKSIVIKNASTQVINNLNAI